ncbi:MAG: DUF1844 domain-containing protein [Bradymonadales bacterium]|jgi:hypothetical protein
MTKSDEGRSITFTDFILSLSTNAMAALGKIDDEAFIDYPRDPAMAKTNIDLLVLLREKTKGNLSDEEEKLLQSLLYDLQMLYLQECKK